ncbi:related to GPI mannosyltransferase 3 [Zygosaccharomyces bailii]|nr:related to GPI mannosyltransferase 3 [Zygosaccharomyces bailii]
MPLLPTGKRARWIVCTLVISRITNALFTRTFFQADEFWQALEPAHFKAFGYGTLTWEWQYGLRSYAFPFLFELAYRSISLISRMARHWLGDEAGSLFEYYGVIYAPKIMMAIIAALGEFYTIMFVRKLYLLSFDKKDDIIPHEDWVVTRITMFLTLTNFFNCFLITRTFINCFEMCLTAVALYYWDWSGGEEIYGSDFTKSLVVALFACWQRPTNGLVWLVLGGYLVATLASKGCYNKIMYLIVKTALAFALVILFSTVIDFYFYGRLIFPPILFFKFNVMSPLSSFYGTNQWHFHITQSLPLMLNYNIPLFFLGIWAVCASKQTKAKIWIQVVAVIFFNLLAYSILSHKEFRFIYPLQPLCMAISAFGALKLKQDYTIKHFTFVIPVISVISAMLLIWYHESGTISVIKYLHGKPSVDSIGFLMPCHSTPWQSYLHRSDIDNLWAITCDPPLHLIDDPDADQKLPNYMDESDFLYEDVFHFITHAFPPFENGVQQQAHLHSWPEYLVVFEHLEKAFLKEYLKKNYREEIRFFNSLAHWDSRRQGDVIVYHKL